MKYDITVNSLFEIKEVKETYYKKAGNKGFSKKPDTIEENIISEEDYNNIINSHEFFKSFGSERMYKSYTYIGYIPTRIVSTSPDRQTKIIRLFKIIKK